MDGRYYDSKGNPTKYLKGVEAKAARGAQLLEKQKDEEAKVPSCNSRWSQDEGSEVSFAFFCFVICLQIKEKGGKEKNMSVYLMSK